MKTLKFFILFLTICIAVNSNAKIWRVNNNPGVQADFTTAQDAHDGATAGDTIYFESSQYSYGNISILKKVTIIGPGYFLNENFSNLPNYFPATIETVTIGCIDIYESNPADVDGTVINGCDLSLVILGVANSITISKNNIDQISLGVEGMTSSPHNMSNIIIKQNYINGGIGMTRYIALSERVISNLIICNNYLYHTISLGSKVTAIISNNTFDFGIGMALTITNSIIENNIFNTSYLSINASSPANFGSSIFKNNICVSASISTGATLTQSDNITGVNIDNIFIGLTGNTADSQWKLKEGSPAIGAGEDGADCGIFGGPTPYVLSGIPNIPSIYYLNISNMPNSTLKVNVKARAN